jgi:serine protease
MIAQSTVGAARRDERTGIRENSMLRRSLRHLFLVALLSVCVPLAAAQTVSRIRVMLHPYAANAGQLPDAALSMLQSVTGVPLTPAGVTRTGALEFTLSQPVDAATAAGMLQRLRNDRNVLWAETVVPAPSSVRINAARESNSAPAGRKVMLRLADPATPDWTTLLPRLSAAAGATLAVDHQIGDVWVLTLAGAVADAQLAQVAALLQTDPVVQYADPVRRVTKQLVPNDPQYAQQWALADSVGSVNAPTAWSLQTGSTSIAVAVIDTGVTAHPEFSSRFLPGYDFISDPAHSNDGGGRDNDASDPGDATSDGECGPGVPGEPSSWHGTFVSGLIAATGNNAIGIAGMDWKAKILPVRVLGRCGGSFDDVTAGLLWAAGLPVAGAPLNPSPARVINMSLGGPTSCPQALQDAINAVLGQGAVITVAAGNGSEDTANSAPANCGGVITVAASTRQGDRASYSNFGSRVNLSAPGGDGALADRILSTSNDGKTSPGNPIYARSEGTSFAAPYVAGTASLMFARNANLTPGQVLTLLSITARSFPAGTVCAQGGTCGSGLLDAGLALQSTVPATDTAPPGTVPVVEYYRADKDHYFMTADPAEMAYFDTVLAPVYQRTGQVFYAWSNPSLAPAGTPLAPVCRFYSPLPLIDSHFFTAIASECNFMIANWPGTWNLESPAAFYVLLSDGNGACPDASIPIYRFFNNRNDANMRHTRDLTVRREMLNKQWAPNGFGPIGVAFCTPT